MKHLRWLFEKQWSAWALAIALLAPVGLFAGGDISGGGKTIFVKGKPIFWDLFLAEETVAPRPGLKLPVTKALKSVSLEHFPLENSRLEEKVRSRLKKWEPSSPELVKALLSALPNAPIYYTSHRIAMNDRSAFIPEKSHISEDQLQPIAVYLKRIGILISKGDFDAMDDVNQVALILHELMRHVQITYHFQMSNQSLQKVTARLAIGEPQEGETLDKPPYLDGQLLLLGNAVVEGAEKVKTATDQLKSIRNKYPNQLERLDFECSVKPESQAFFDLANLAGEMSSILLQYRTNPKSKLSEREALEVEKDEDRLGRIVVTLRSSGITKIGKSAQDSRQEIADALLKASVSGLDDLLKDINRSSLTQSRSAEKTKLRGILRELVKAKVLK